jgi:hypothetical protein
VNRWEMRQKGSGEDRGRTIFHTFNRQIPTWIIFQHTYNNLRSFENKNEDNVMNRDLDSIIRIWWRRGSTLVLVKFTSYSKKAEVLKGTRNLAGTNITFLIWGSHGSEYVSLKCWYLPINPHSITTQKNNNYKYKNWTRLQYRDKKNVHRVNSTPERC